MQVPSVDQNYLELDIKTIIFPPILPKVKQGSLVSMILDGSGSEVKTQKYGIMDMVLDYGTVVPRWYTGQCPLIDGDPSGVSGGIG